MRPIGVYDGASEHELHCHDVEACACVTRIVRTNGVYDLASDRDIECHDVWGVVFGFRKSLISSIFQLQPTTTQKSERREAWKHIIKVNAAAFTFGMGGPWGALRRSVAEASFYRNRQRLPKLSL